MTFLENTSKHSAQKWYVVFGDEDFLKRRVIQTLTELLLDGVDPEYSLSRLSGEGLTFPDLRNELDSVSFFSSKRVVLLQEADSFVSNNRPLLEKYMAQPSEIGILILEMKSFPATTKLAKLTPDAAQIACKTPSESAVALWISRWAETQYGKSISRPTANRLLELIGPNLGLIDSELSKLNQFIGTRKTIAIEDVEELVAQTRTNTIFRVFELIGEGKSAQALGMLQEILNAPPEEYMKLLGGISYQVRKLVKVFRLVQRKVAWEEAMDQAGIPKFPMIRDGVRKQIRHIGAKRLNKLLEQIPQLDRGLKGGSELPPRLQMERFFVELMLPAQSNTPQNF